MKRMFRVAVSCTVAVEAESCADAINAVRYIHIWDPSVRKLSVAVLSSWVDKPKDVPAAPEVMPDMSQVKTPVRAMEKAATAASVHNAAAGEQAFKDSNSSTYRDPAPEVDDIPF
jgi:hypothetical protein